MLARKAALLMSFFLALGPAHANAAPDGQVVPVYGSVSDQDADRALREIPLPSLAASSNSAEATPIPELPTWGMMILCLLGLGLARLRRGRGNRLSPGIE
jgi:hypothetical protein